MKASLEDFFWGGEMDCSGLCDSEATTTTKTTKTQGGAKYIHVKQQKSILFDGVLGPKIQEEKT